ncbi:MAG: ComEC/Rec2 family competence protein [bacterium]
MANDFDRYRKVREEHGGRVDVESNVTGWIVVGVLLVITCGAWFFALPTYRSLLSGDLQASLVRSSSASVTSSLPVNYQQSSTSKKPSAQGKQVQRPQQPGFLLRERKPDEMAVVFFDVGQGDAIFIKTPRGKNILVDCGEGKNPDYPMARKVDAANTLLLPFFARNNIQKLHYYIASHPHSDHIGAAYDLLKKMPVKEVWIAGHDHPSTSKENMLKIIDKKGLTMKAPAKIGGDLKEGMKMDRLGPGVKGWLLRTAPKDENTNNSSLVNLFYYGENSVLLTGDIEGTREGGGFGEQELVKMWGEQINVDVLKVSHHGSRFSTTEEFLDFVKPKYAVIQVGHYNTFGHPTPETLTRLREAETEKIYRNDEDGTVFMFMDGKNIRVKTRRDMSAVN